MTKKHDITPLIPQENIESKVYLLRNRKVMLDQDLAKLYEVPTKALNQAIKRNVYRFPSNFMFGLTKNEKEQLVTVCDRFKNLKHSTSLPCAFTELGVAMLSSVLNSERAIRVNIEIIRTFVKMREMIQTHQDLWIKIDQLEKKYDQQFQVVFKAIKALIDEKPRDGRKRF